MALTLEELMGVVQKAGLPLEELTKIRKSAAYGQESLAPELQAIYDPAFKVLDDEKKQKLQSLANADRQLSQIFGQGGKFALTNPSDTERIIAGAEGVSYQDLNRLAQKKGSLQSEMEKDVQRAASLIDTTTGEGVGDSKSYSELVKIFPWMKDNLSLEDILSQNNDTDSETVKRPPLDDIFNVSLDEILNPLKKFGL